MNYNEEEKKKLAKLAEEEKKVLADQAEAQRIYDEKMNNILKRLGSILVRRNAIEAKANARAKEKK